MASDNLSERLNRINGHIADGYRPVPASSLPSRYGKLAGAVGGELLAGEAGAFCLVRTAYEDGSRFGSCTLEPRSYDAHVPYACFTAGLSDGVACLSDLLFFDIETTGLGGAGTVPFLVGFGSLSPGGFELRQYLLPDYSDERGMLEHLAGELTPDKTLVTYNGAAFDLNLLQDRLIINRVSREIEVQGHIDLLHATRRLFRRRLGDCTLANVERELFGFFRQGDIPGYLIPSVYFSWLSEERADDILNVLEHNRLDIFSLYFLLRHIVSVFASEGRELYDVDDVYSLSRVYGRRRQNDRVVNLLDGIQGTGGGAIEADILLYQAQALKRAGKPEAAARLWEQLCGEKSREGYRACIELAKYFEHQVRDVSRAYRHAQRAVQVCPYGETHKKDLRRRLKRLDSKLSRR
ncbi:MAG TPA: ribonuclease H-like domain-containing protein [Acidobacteriota bacterium]|nr:ribonuclease H-like domain-containing protein [Acidobacteriota bacterium]